MDPNTAYRFAICIAGYYEHGTHVCHDTCNKNWVRDKDTISWMDLYADLDDEIKQGSVQSSSVSFWDKVACEYSDIDFDSSLLAAIDMYWDIRRLPVVVSIIIQPSHVSSLCIEVAAVDMKSSPMLICSIEMKSDFVANVTNDPDDPDFHTNDPCGENDEIECRVSILGIPKKWGLTDKQAVCQRCLMKAFSYNLLSVSQLLDEGFEVRFKNGSSRILDSQGELVCMIIPEGQIFRADVSTSFGPSRCLVASSSSELWKWHRRLERLSFNLLSCLSSLGLV
jgi:hypothetical protein